MSDGSCSHPPRKVCYTAGPSQQVGETLWEVKSYCECGAPTVMTINITDVKVDPGVSGGGEGD